MDWRHAWFVFITFSVHTRHDATLPPSEAKLAPITQSSIDGSRLVVNPTQKLKETVYHVALYDAHGILIFSGTLSDATVEKDSRGQLARIEGMASVDLKVEIVIKEEKMDLLIHVS